MKQQDKEEKQANRRQTLHRLCSGSGLLLSVVCCIAIIHAELRIQEHHRLISHSVTFCKNMETEILRKVQQNYERWQVKVSGRHWQPTKGISFISVESESKTLSPELLLCASFHHIFLFFNRRGPFTGCFETWNIQEESKRDTVLFPRQMKTK